MASLLLYGGHADSVDELVALLPEAAPHGGPPSASTTPRKAAERAFEIFFAHAFTPMPPADWLSALFPMGPDLHDVLRTKNGIHFSQAAKPFLSFKFPVRRGVGSSGDLSLKIMQGAPDGFDGLGAVVWQCGIALAHFLAQHPDLDRLLAPRCRGGCSKSGCHRFVDSHVMDLGCGTGLVGLVAAACGARRVVLSDRREIVSYAKANLDTNSERLGDVASNAVQIHAYEWSEEEEVVEGGDRKEAGGGGVIASRNDQSVSSRDESTYDLVICSDCFYDAASFPGLFRTIEGIVTKTRGQVKFLFGYKLRHAAREAAFFQKLEQQLGADLCVFGQAAVSPRNLRGLGIHIVHVSFPSA